MFDSNQWSKRFPFLANKISRHLEEDSSWKVPTEETSILVDQAIAGAFHSDANGVSEMGFEQTEKSTLLRIYLDHLKTGDKLLLLIKGICQRDRFIAKREQSDGEIVLVVDDVARMVLQELNTCPIEQLSLTSIKKTVIKKSINRLRMIARRKSNRRFWDFHELGTEPPSKISGSTGSRGVISQEQQEWLMDCLEKLNHRQRHAVEQKHKWDVDVSTISSELKVTKSNARQLVCRGMRRLRECLLQKGMSAQDLP